MKTISLPVYRIIVTIEDGSGTITSNLKENEDEFETFEEKKSITLYNASIDGIESMIMAHAVAGIDIESPAYLEGIEAAIQGCANNF